jgi:hypothetical protein
VARGLSPEESFTAAEGSMYTFSEEEMNSFRFLEFTRQLFLAPEYNLTL